MGKGCPLGAHGLTPARTDETAESSPCRVSLTACLSEGKGGDVAEMSGDPHWEVAIESPRPLGWRPAERVEASRAFTMPLVALVRLGAHLPQVSYYSLFNKFLRILVQ